MTATPVHAIPRRLAAARDKLLGRTPGAEGEAAGAGLSGQPAPRLRRPRQPRRRVGALAGDAEPVDLPYDSPLVDGPDEKTPPPSRAVASRLT
ncbi:MAG: hypothetical protein WKF83_00680 [Nocardioidaceae bacterium]